MIRSSRAGAWVLGLPLLIGAVLPGQDAAPRLLDGLSYRCVGPSRGGRSTAVAGDPSRPGTFYMGSTGGGVWKTVDYGQTWRNVSDGHFDTGSIGSIRVAPSNPDVVWVGTGSDGLRSNVIRGKGVFRSDDAGKTWRRAGLRDAGQIGAVVIHPEDPNTVWVAVIGHAFGPSENRGVYLTRDGGKSWRKTLFVSERTGAVDLELHPTRPEVVYASMWEAERKPWTILSGGREGGVHRSTDGGETWTQLAGGLPSGLVGKSDLAVSPAAPDRLYVLIEADPDPGLYRSDDRGETFRLVTSRRSLLDRPFYYTNIDADPQNADVLYSNSTGFYRSRDAGKSWERRRTPHGDNHDIWIHPKDSDLYIQANDGGANVTRDGGKTWSTQQNQLTAELYQVEVDDRFPYWLYAGQQDNSTIRVPSRSPFSHPAGPTGYWQSIGGCETGPAVPKPGDPDIVYANCKGRFGRFNLRTGQEKQYYVGAGNMYGHNPRDLQFRFQRVAPIHVSPHDPNVIYHASQFLHRTTDEGVTWEKISPDLTANEPDKQVISGSPITRDITGEEFYSTIYSVRESKLEKGLIWVGANDGPVHVTRDGGRTWKKVTPPDLPPGGRVDAVEPSPHRPEKAYFAAYRYLLGDWAPYIFRTTDYGRTWTRLTSGDNGLPADAPTRVIREDPDREGLLYAGTDDGMFVSFDDGTRWESLQLNMPATPITDVKVHRQDLVLATMGRSFWILDDVTPLHQLDAASADRPLHVFAPRPAHRVRGRGSRAAPGRPEYPSGGALLHFWLAADAERTLLEILDARGQVIRSYSSGSGGRRRGDLEDGGMRRFRFRTLGSRRLPRTAGLHRFRWDLRRAGDRGRNGPMVVPGTYRVRLTAGKEVRETSLQVLIDPRVAADGVTQADLVAQEALQLRIGQLGAAARKLTSEVRRARRALRDARDGDGPGAEKAKARDASLAELQDRLVTKSGRYETPMLNDQIRYLASMLDRADQKPGRDAYERLDHLTEWHRQCRKTFDGLK